MTNKRKRIGFCCKWLSDNTAKSNIENRDLNGKSTTMKWLREHPETAIERQWELMNFNACAAYNMVERVGSLDPELRQVRLGSEMLQGYTESNWKDWWQQPSVQAHLESIFAPVGDLARELDVRLSFHPGQFCCLVSDNPNTVENSLAEMEYHTDLARWMGYGKRFQDFKINVHVSGRQGPSAMRNIVKRMSPELRNCLTLENDEFTIGIDDLIELRDIAAIVFDVHHHWIKTGEYFDPQDERVNYILESWRGVRPVMHYSQCREDLLVGHDPNVMPDMNTLLEQGFKKTKLRAHSDFMWNSAQNEQMLEFWEWTDIQVEAKAKNLASADLLDQWTQKSRTDSPAQNLHLEVI